MGALFSRRSDRRLRLFLILLGATPLMLVFGLMAWVRLPVATGQNRGIEQPVPFDHRIHARLGIACRYCHVAAERSRFAGLPPTRSCVPCHNPVWLASAPFAPVRTSLATGKPIPWRRVHALPDFVFFSHGAHHAAGIGCQSCHGRVEEMGVVRQVAPLTMAWCVDCHRLQDRAGRRSITHCSGCHW